MATKKVTSSDLTFAAALAHVQPALAAWRQRRKHREPIPQALWRAMATLARVHGLSPVAQALKVNCTALKRHMESSAAGIASGVDTMPASFVEAPMTAWPQAPHWVIELEDRDGSQLTLRLPPGDSSAALALAQGLWGQRA